MIKLGFALSLLVCSSAIALECPKDTIIKQSEDGQNQLHSWCETGDVRQGPYEVFAMQGGLRVSAAFKDGKLEGPFKRYNENGRVTVEGQYSAGRMKGQWTRYWPNGKARDQGQWRGDKPVGKWNYFAEDGTFLREKDFSEKSETVYLEDVYRIRAGFAHTDRNEGEDSNAEFLGLGAEARLLHWARWIRMDLSARLVPEKNMDSRHTVVSGQLGLSFDLLRRFTGPMAFYFRIGAHFYDLNNDHGMAGIGLRYQPRRTEPGFRYGGLFVEYSHVDYEWDDRNRCTSGPCPTNTATGNNNGDNGLNVFFAGAFWSVY